MNKNENKIFINNLKLINITLFLTFSDYLTLKSVNKIYNEFKS